MQPKMASTNAPPIPAARQSTSPFIAASNYGTFIFFGVVTTIGVLYVWFLVPETKGRTLEEMDELFGSGSIAVEDEALKRRIEREIGLLALPKNISLLDMHSIVHTPRAQQNLT
ncbi:hypothetical protein CFD26_107379 [Aspergillus turcosus]|uniref:Major facilitator superfamily (MFS) profile domain-containing protein n=1 Tax=Aspergillus turcosus TaxID=1245748 RepID=A0A3R7GB29_9EURO|nr:hypothetical protein CFD26_107379 [Aspergillus turcosus]